MPRFRSVRVSACACARTQGDDHVCAATHIGVEVWSCVRPWNERRRLCVRPWSYRVCAHGKRHLSMFLRCAHAKRCGPVRCRRPVRASTGPCVLCVHAKTSGPTRRGVCLHACVRCAPMQIGERGHDSPQIGGRGHDSPRRGLRRRREMVKQGMQCDCKQGLRQQGHPHAIVKDASLPTRPW